MRLVADTNVLAELFLPARQSSQVLLKYIRADLLEASKGLAIWQRALERLAPLERCVDGQEVLALALRHQCSSYDAEFVVLAQQLGCPLLTFDRKLLQLFPDLAVQPGS